MVRRAALTSIVLGSWLAAPMSWSAACPGADAEALTWLDKMSRSVNQVSYHGVVTYQRGDADMQVMQVAHSVAEGTSSESMMQLTGQGAQVVRVDHPLHCVHPGHKLLRVGSDLQEGRCEIAGHYRFSATEGERVAGRKAVSILIEPRDMYRYGYVMALDRKTGLLLKTVTLGRGNRVLEKFQFADISYQGETSPSADISLVHQAKHPVPNGLDVGKVIAHNWKALWVPKGFIATDSAVADSRRKTYTDGLAVFSVFVEELGRGIRPGEGVVQEGSTTSYTRGLRIEDKPILITVMGEIPINTARMVADSIRWVR